MKYTGLPPLKVNDLDILTEFLKAYCKNEGIDFNHLYQIVSNAYIEYLAHKGDPWEIFSLDSLDEKLKENFRKHYKSKAERLKFVSEIRHALRSDCCPMCGSVKPPGQVDHFLPQANFAEFSFFMPNLVSACDCNGQKMANFKGANWGERLMHPYFDQNLMNRLVYIAFEGEPDKPTLSVKCTSDYLNNPAVNFHIATVLNKTTLLNKSIFSWSVLADDPRGQLHLRHQKYPKVTEEDIREKLSDFLDSSDKKNSSLNNWDSMFYFGLLNSPSQVTLLAKVCELQRPST